MCGIAGIYGGVERNRLKSMTSALRHRGPDDETYWIHPQGIVGFGHRRLSIIDLECGRQPMMNEDGNVVVVFNGEIYNYRELREELRSRGHTLTTQSDTEAIVHLYEECGVDVAKKLRGMFAIAIWDDRERQLILIRDRAGKKPLYYCSSDAEFLFASEIKGIVAAGGKNRDLNPRAIRGYLAWGAVPAPETIYREVRVLRPGHVLVMRDGHVIREVPYWQLRFVPKTSVSRGDAIARIDAKLREAVRLRLRSDVPVGTFLSGGIDSGIITAMASQEHPGRLTTITIGFEDAAFDERPLAKQVADRYGTDHQEIVVRPNVAEDLPRIAAAYDQPFGDSSAVPSYYVAKAARQFVKVVLNGDGGDELFAGYRRYIAGRLADRLGPLDSAALRPLWSLMSWALPTPRGFRTGYAFAHRLIRGLSLPADRRAAAWTVDGFDQTALHTLGMSNGGLPGIPDGGPINNDDPLVRAALAELGGLGPLDSMLGFDFLTILPNDLLVKMDIATMAHSLEARSPMLDHELIELAATLPESLKLSGFSTKPLLRSLAAKYLPEEVCRAPKRGFEAPVTRWLKEELHDMVTDTILSQRGLIRELLDRTVVEGLLENRSGLDPARWSRRVWLLFMLGLWDVQVRRAVEPAAAL